ncbi:cell division protein DivIVA [Mycobacterium gordonae]|uniref:Cell division protein DivIVA n=1 Tax=Mycobacterium gordonae TaxID=1778 RepID=A0A0Q2M9Q2_MYCGO|nr:MULTISPECIES: DivIVA domain-containing protein [Mycobacterium]KQH76583.1 cell division protein DivIVA [Mycobacterium gordonae]MDP7729036.1 DivIVA domain-containing protein [Mycobacterium sp. TY813]
MVTEPVKTFSRKFFGYDPATVDAHIEVLGTKQRLLRDDVESLRARLRDSGDEVASLRKEVAQLTETSPSPHAMQQRMAKMLQRAVEEVSQMQAEARAEAQELITSAGADIEAEQQKSKEQLAEMTERLKALQDEYDETRAKQESELSNMRAATQSGIDEAWREAQQERDQLLADARQEADHYREQARRAVDEATQQRINVLEQLMSVYRDLEPVPAALESAHAELNQTATNGTADRKVRTA